jgi:hypothetical protein
MPGCFTLSRVRLSECHPLHLKNLTREIAYEKGRKSLFQNVLKERRISQVELWSRGIRTLLVGRGCHSHKDRHERSQKLVHCKSDLFFSLTVRGAWGNKASYERREPNQRANGWSVETDLPACHSL